MIPGQKEQAEILRVELTFGYRSVEDAVAWAYSIIEADPSPDGPIIEIVLAANSSPGAMTVLLRNVAGVFDPAAVVRQALDAPIAAVLATDRSPAEMAALLGNIAEVCDSNTVMRHALGVMLRVLDSDPERAPAIGGLLYDLAMSKLLPEHQFGKEPYTLGDALQPFNPKSRYDLGVTELREYLGRESQPPAVSG
jgi:hypothetical protein